MAKFIINKGKDSEITVEADGFKIEDGFVSFDDPNGALVFSIPVARVVTVEAENVRQ